MSFEDEDFYLVDGWWTFFGGSCMDARQLKSQKSLQITRRAGAGNPFSTREGAQRLRKVALSRTFQTDARTRTGDPFITSYGQLSLGVIASHFRPLCSAKFPD
jgi:hypothetical protein